VTHNAICGLTIVKKEQTLKLLQELEESAMNEEQVRGALIEWESLSANKENRAI
jgi:hypothetical protein